MSTPQLDTSSVVVGNIVANALPAAALTGNSLLAVPTSSPAADAMRGVSEDLWSRRTAILDHIEALEIQAATLMEAAIEVEWTAHLLEQAA